MKKIIISIATISVFIFTSCFTDTDTATVKINLGNIPLAKTAKVEKKSIIDRFVALFLKEAVAQPVVPLDTNVSVVHLGAFDANNQLLAKDSIIVTGDPDAENTVVEFDVPAGVRRKIVVLGEKIVIRNILDPDSGEPSPEEVNAVGYYGVSIETELIAGENKEVSIEMEFLPENFPSLNLEHYGTHSESGKPATWDHITGASEYNIYKRDYNEITQISTIHKEPISNTKENEFYKHVYDKTYSLRIYFDFAKIESADCFFKIC